MWKIGLVISVMVIGCAQKPLVEQSYAPSGQVSYSTTCSTRAIFGAAIEASWSDCYSVAGRQCGSRGFSIIDRTENEGFTVYKGSGAATRTRAMVFTCNDTRGGANRETVTATA